MLVIDILMLQYLTRIYSGLNDYDRYIMICNFTCVLMLKRTAATCRSFTSSVLSSQLPGEHAADVCAAAAHRCRCGIYKVCGVGECGAVAPTSQWRSSWSHADTQSDHSVATASRAAAHGRQRVEVSDTESFSCRRYRSWTSCHSGMIVFISSCLSNFVMRMNVVGLWYCSESGHHCEYCHSAIMSLMCWHCFGGINSL